MPAVPSLVADVASVGHDVPILLLAAALGVGVRSRAAGARNGDAIDWDTKKLKALKP